MALEPKFREEHVDVIVSFLRHHVDRSGRAGVVLGMSGGVDSSVVAKLAVMAVGADRVFGLSLPEAEGGPDQADARSFAAELGIGFRSQPIGKAVEALRSELGILDDRVGLGNVKARVRMIALYQVARAEDRLVLGTGNKTEALVGYFTKFGDGGCDFAPIGDLYKTQVREMARFLHVPAAIREKPPSADLWDGQTDEGDLGIAYERLDRVLLGIELQMEPPEIAARAEVPVGEVSRIARLVAANVHKRKTPLSPKIGVRTIGLDWRE